MAALIITVGLSLVIIAIAAGLTARNHSFRSLVMGIGLGAIPVGLFLTGVTDLTINGVLSLIAWFQRTPFTNLTGWGIGLVVGGIVLFVIGTFLPKGQRPEVGRSPEKAKVAGKDSKPQKPNPAIQGSGRPGQPTTGPSSAQPQQAKPQPGPAAKKQNGLDPEDAEIEALLRKRGIM